MAGNWNKDSVASVATIDAAGLATPDPNSEKQKLLQALQLSGMFNVWLGSTPEGQEILKMVPEMYRISETYFSQPDHMKQKDQRFDQKPNQDRGYKCSDCDETFEFSLDEIKSKSLRLPSSLEKDQATIEQFTELCHKVCEDVLRTVGDGLGYKNDELQKQHQGLSDSGLKLISEPALEKLSDVGDNTHCDSGTLTMLITDKWGILGKDKDGDNWAFTEPVDGCALIHGANSLQRMTDGQAHSLVHCVTQRGDGAEPRTFLSYFLRPSYATA